MTTDTTPAERTGLIGYPEAARLLNLNIQAVRSLVVRGELHTQPGPGDKRRRFLSQQEVQQYAVRRLLRGAIGIDAPVSGPAPAGAPNVSRDLSRSPQRVGAVAASVAFLLLLILAFKSADAATRALIVGAVAGVAALIIVEWQQQGRISAQEARRLQALASKAESEPEPFMSELERLLGAAA